MCAIQQPLIEVVYILQPGHPRGPLSESSESGSAAVETESLNRYVVERESLNRYAVETESLNRYADVKLRNLLEYFMIISSTSSAVYDLVCT